MEQPATPPIVKKGPRWGLIGALGCGGLIVLVLLIGVCATLMKNAGEQSSEPSTAVDEQDEEAADASERETESQTTWQQVASWSGSGIKETETFDIQSREWRISWETSNEPFQGAGIMQIMVYDENGNLKTLAANKQGVGGDVSYVRGEGNHYLMINSGNVDWVVTVEDQR